MGWTLAEINGQYTLLEVGDEQPLPLNEHFERVDAVLVALACARACSATGASEPASRSQTPNRLFPRSSRGRRAQTPR